jgi:hypothetical protein
MSKIAITADNALELYTMVRNLSGCSGNAGIFLGTSGEITIKPTAADDAGAAEDEATSSDEENDHDDVTSSNEDGWETSSSEDDEQASKGKRTAAGNMTPRSAKRAKD